MTEPSGTKWFRFINLKINAVDCYVARLSVRSSFETIFPTNLLIWILFYYSKSFELMKINVTTSNSESSSTNIHVHLRMVFSSEWNIDRLQCSTEYRFRKFKLQSRCAGTPPLGTTFSILYHMRLQTRGVIPKNDLKRRRATCLLAVAFVSV